MSEKDCVSTVCTNQDDGVCTYGDGTMYCAGRELPDWSIEDEWQEQEIVSRKCAALRRDKE